MWQDLDRYPSNLIPFIRVPVESFDESLMENTLVSDDNEYDSDDSDDSQNVSTNII